MKKILSLILVLCLSLAISVTAFAAEIDTSGGTGSTPVELTTTNGGIGGGEDDIAPTKLSVTVPTALPMAMSDDGSFFILHFYRTHAMRPYNSFDFFRRTHAVRP